MSDPEPPPPDATCDGGDLDCGSGLLLIIRKAMAPLSPGSVLLVKSREISVKEDLPAWCRMVGHSMLAECPANGGYTHYFLRKKVEDAELDKDLQSARDHAWQVRVRWTEGMQAKVTVRNHGFVVGQPASFDTEDAAPSAIEYLLSALGGAVATGFQWRLSRRQIEVFALEVVAKAKSQNSLVFLGVDEDGSAALAPIQLSLYVDADCEEALLDEILEETLRRCPVTQSLMSTVAIDTRLRIV
ncbi:MAG: OsmC family protein [Planctomycetes bacterium]|nr:OsmC family protein [Planctomycetota bacterium]MCB9890978.1 OsmC family protein [Planctomycetota bacterium]MCB9919169.1 OsmC family protein [Planctomycetota bacterium]